MSGEDFLGRCSGAQTGNPILEHVRGKSAEVTLAVYRLVKNALLHSLDNAAVRDACAGCAKILDAFAAEIGSTVTLTFVEESVFVCGQLMRATRGTYEAASELGEILRGVGVSELSFERGASAAALLQLVRALVSAIRDPSARAALLDARIPGVTARKVDPRLARKRADTGATPEDRALRLYATALVVMRQFYEDVGGGVTVLPHRVKRLAQRFVALALERDPAMLGMTIMAKSHRDDAGRAVQTAILSLAVARQITQDRVLLSQVALAALMTEAGGARVRANAGDRYLGDEEEAGIPAAGAFACIATGGVNPQNGIRTVAVTEAAWAERSAMLGEPWNGKVAPLLTSQIIALARDVLELLAPRDGGEALSALAALEAVVARPGRDPVLVRLLVRALGVVPIGTMVHLSNGAWAVVIGPSSVAPHACIVRVVTDTSGAELASPVRVDLGAESSLSIARVAAQGQLSGSASRSFVGG
jgi:hypothetical protein